MNLLTPDDTPRYASFAAANSAADLGGSNPEWRTSAPNDDGAFLVPVSHGGCARDAFGHAGVHSGRSANLRTVAPIRCLAATGDDSKPNGVSPMAIRLFPTLSPSKSRAAAHRAMAKAALLSNFSLSVRVRRYNSHMDRARALEAQLQEVAK